MPRFFQTNGDLKWLIPALLTASVAAGIALYNRSGVRADASRKGDVEEARELTKLRSNVDMLIDGDLAFAADYGEHKKWGEGRSIEIEKALGGIHADVAVANTKLDQAIEIGGENNKLLRRLLEVQRAKQ